MKFILVVLLASFCFIELAHLNYHAQQGVQPSNIDKNFWTLISYKQHWSIPHRGYHNCWSCRSLRSLLYTQCHAVLYWRSTDCVGERAKRAGTVSYIDTNTYQYQNICLAVERHFNKCLLHADNGATLCHTMWVVKTTACHELNLKRLHLLLIKSQCLTCCGVTKCQRVSVTNPLRLTVFSIVKSVMP